MAAEKINDIDLEPYHDEHWQVTDLSGANWCLKMISRARSRMTENKAFVEAEIAKLQDWLNEANDNEISTVNFFEAKLRPFAEQQLEGSKKKSITLPYGSLGFRLTTSTTKDSKVLMDYLKETYPELLRKKFIEEPDLVSLKKFCTVSENGDLITPEGEAVPGYNITTENIFYTKTA